LFLLVLNNVAEANGGMAVLAEKATLSRESLYRMLPERGNSEIESFFSRLPAMGLRLAVEPKEHECPTAKCKQTVTATLPMQFTGYLTGINPPTVIKFCFLVADIS
jgi:hypothetical protein